jgi:hypothetical protein
MKSPHVTYLEQRVADLEAREKVLLDRLLIRNGVGSLAPVQERRSVPNPRPVHPWRIMAKKESEAWSQFNDTFPSFDDIAKERNG